MRKLAEKKITAKNSEIMTGSLNLFSAHGQSDGFPKRERPKSDLRLNSKHID